MIKILDADNIKLCSINKKYNKNFSLTPEYRGFKLLIKTMAKKKHIDPPLSILIVMETALDIDASIKPIFDGLEGICFDNDKDILDARILKRKIKRGHSGRLKIFADTIDIDEHNKIIDAMYEL